MPGRRTLAPVLIAIALALLTLGFSPVHAAPTQYSLTLSPNRTQEQTLPGVALTLTVSDASTAQPYSFTFIVTDPSNAKSNATRTTVPPAPTFSFILTYPTDFTGGAIKYVGQYNVNVAQNAPAISTSVASSHFTVGLTDKPSYQRTFPVSIKADGYSPSETLTVNITHQSVAAPSFPTIINADPSGNLSFSWPTTPDLPTGNYTVTVTGSSTVKIVRDYQSFWLYPTNVTVSQIFSQPGSLMRTQTVHFSFSANYLGGGTVQSGSATVIIKQPDGTAQPTSADYNVTSGLFSASYRIPLTALEGDWTATIRKNSINDGYGNGGPDNPPSTPFTVVPASLNVNLTFTGGSITTGNVVAIYSTITSPDGTSFTAGTVSALVSPPGRTVGNQVNLLYDTSRTKWVGSYTVTATDPSGLWVVQVSASDPYGNSGSGSTSSLVTVVVPHSQGSTLTAWFLTAFGAIAAGLLVGLLLLRRERTFRHQLHVDLRAVGQEASKVKNQEFFKSIKEQIDRQQEGKDS